MLPIALQLYSVRDDLERDFEGTIAKVKAMGFDGVEPAGLHGKTPEEAAAIFAANGLTAISAHVPYNEMVKDTAGVLNAYKTLGCKFIAIPYLEDEYRKGGALYEETVENINKIGQQARAAGITLLYHNHDFEFQKFDGEYALDILYNTLPADVLQAEIDTCWVNVGGEVPADYIRKYKGRAPVVHLKDFHMPGERPAKLYDLIGLPEDKREAAAEVFEFRPVGSGKQNIPEIIAAANDAGAQWLVVEQDMPSFGKTPLECAESSITYLRSL